MKIIALCRVEAVKLKRSSVVPVTFAAVTALGAALGFFIWIMLNPGMAGKLGLMGQKASLTLGGTIPTWGAFLTLMTEVLGLGGMLFAMVIFTWVFGREYVQGTAKVMLTLPVSRSMVALAKGLIACTWFVCLMLWLCLIAMGAAWIAGLGVPDAAFVLGLIERLLPLVAANCGLAIGAAWMAVASGGIFAPLGYAIASLLLATMFGSTGWGPYVPWSIVAVMSGAASPGLEAGPASELVLAVWSALGGFLTILHLELADNSQ